MKALFFVVVVYFFLIKSCQKSKGGNHLSNEYRQDLLVNSLTDLFCGAGDQPKAFSMFSRCSTLELLSLTSSSCQPGVLIDRLAIRRSRAPGTSSAFGLEAHS